MCRLLSPSRHYTVREPSWEKVMATSSRPIGIGPLALLAVAGAAFGAASAGEVTTEYQYDEIGNLTRISDVSSDPSRSTTLPDCLATITSRGTSSA